jgi:ABC-type uncharacterized transport system substrate-binding protein
VRNAYNSGAVLQLREAEDALRTLGLQFEVADARTPDEFEKAFARLSANGAHGVVFLADPSLIEHAAKIAELAQQARLPTVFQRRENVDAGGLLSYGPNLSAQFHQVAGHVDRILRGAKPAELPVEQPTKFELVINLKTARALGLDVPWFSPAARRRGDRVKRRAFITLLGGAAAWPVAARAQQGERMRRIGVLVPQDQDSPVAQARIAALLQELRQLGWTGRNARIDIHWAGADAESIRKHAAELATLAPDVILANGSVVVAPLLQATRTVPIVFVVVPDPVGAGFVDSLARPGGNATGFVQSNMA